MSLEKTNILDFIKVLKKYNSNWMHDCCHCPIFNGECNDLASKGKCRAWEAIANKTDALKELEADL